MHKNTLLFQKPIGIKCYVIAMQVLGNTLHHAQKKVTPFL